MLLGNGRDPLIAPMAGPIARGVGIDILAEAPRSREAKPLMAGPLGELKKPLSPKLAPRREGHQRRRLWGAFVNSLGRC
jgi:hypothetical protein